MIDARTKLSRVAERARVIAASQQGDEAGKIEWAKGILRHGDWAGFVEKELIIG